MWIIRYLIMITIGHFSEMLLAAELPDLTQISISEAREMASKPTMGKSYRDFGKAALASGRYEIVDICWEYPYTGACIEKAMLKMPAESKERDALIIMMMRNPRIPWLDPDSPLDGGVLVSGAAENVIPLLRKYLPDLPMKYSVIDTREKRLAIAERYAKAAGIPIYDEGDAKRVWPPPQAGVQGMPTRIPNGVRQRNPATVESPAVAAETHSAFFPLSVPWAVGICIAVVFSGAGWLLYRRLRHKA